MGKGGGKKDKKPGKKSGSGGAAPTPEAPLPAFSPVASLLRWAPGTSLATLDPSAVVAGPTDKAAAGEQTAELEPLGADLHERLWASSKNGGAERVVVVLQGMDTAGKGGATKAVDRLLDPLGFNVATFGPPTAAEKRHHFLWRVGKQVPTAGRVRVFDRSHYEDVLIARVRQLAPAEVIAGRYDEINQWEAMLADQGVLWIKVFLHISKDEQKARLGERLTDPTKYWKYNPNDVDERAYWDAYQASYEIALDRCSTDVAPWYVLPADRKWHRNWLVSNLLLERMSSLDLTWPPATFDVAEEQARLAAS